MKKIILSVILITLSIMILSSCSNTIKADERTEEDKKNSNSMFVLIEENNKLNYKVVYHKDTKVMYTISDGIYNLGTFTVILNNDGKPMIWKGGE